MSARAGGGSAVSGGRVARRLTIAGGLAAAAVVAALGIRVARSSPLAPWAVARARGAAERMYDAHDFKGAYDAFDDLSRSLARAGAAADPATTAEVALDAGAAAYRLGHFADAERHLHTALGGSDAVRARAQYDLGNTYVWMSRAESDKRGTLLSAKRAYEEAVLLDPTDVDAKWNLELVLARIAAEESKMGSGPHREQANWGGGNLTKSGYAGAPQTGAGATPGGGFGAGGGEEAVPELTPSQARRLLEQAERAEVTGQDVRRPPSGARGAAPGERRKDW
ncbi:MAG TPA: hypothetical protein VF041_07675 [Gemmatimonadaceae bacterium]